MSHAERGKRSTGFLPGVIPAKNLTGRDARCVASKDSLPVLWLFFSYHTSLFTSHQILCRLRLLGIRGTHGLAPKSVFGNYLYNCLYFQHIFGSHSRARWPSGRSATPGTPGAPE